MCELHVICSYNKESNIVWLFSSVFWEIDKQTSAITNADKHYYIGAIGSDAPQTEFCRFWTRNALCLTEPPLRLVGQGWLPPTLQNEDPDQDFPTIAQLGRGRAECQTRTACVHHLSVVAAPRSHLQRRFQSLRYLVTERLGWFWAIFSKALFNCLRVYSFRGQWHTRLQTKPSEAILHFVSNQRVFLFPRVKIILIDCSRGDVQPGKVKHCTYWPPSSGTWSTHIISSYWCSKTYKVSFTAFLRYINKTPKPFPKFTKTEDQVIKKKGGGCLVLCVSRWSQKTWPEGTSTLKWGQRLEKRFGVWSTRCASMKTGVWIPRAT